MLLVTEREFGNVRENLSYGLVGAGGAGAAGAAGTAGAALGGAPGAVPVVVAPGVDGDFAFKEKETFLIPIVRTLSRRSITMPCVEFASALIKTRVSMFSLALLSFTSASNLGPPRVQKYTKGASGAGVATLSRWGLAKRNEFVALATDEWSAARPQRLPHLMLPIRPLLA